ncbi:MAG TPA: hypothetical protein VGF29_20290 [Hyphomicrobiaceae bacterium]|jgi:hypothetical protein
MVKIGLTRGSAAGKALAVLLAVLLAAVAACGAGLLRPALAVDVSPLERLQGRWVGEGRLGVKGNPTEQVKCRVTYLYARPGDELKQTIRCASAGGSVEVQSAVSHVAGKLTGSWKELVRDLSGDLTGAVTPHGFKVKVRGDSLNANMDIILVNARQVIEIQFVNNATLIGLTLVLERG